MIVNVVFACWLITIIKPYKDHKLPQITIKCAQPRILIDFRLKDRKHILRVAPIKGFDLILPIYTMEFAH